MRWKTMLIVLLAIGWVGFATLPTMAQPNRNQQGGRRGAQGGQEGRRPSGGRFDLRGPEVGTALPDIQLYDEQGEQISLASIKGSYSVIVFGCLT